MLLVRHLLAKRSAPHVLAGENSVLEASRFLRANRIGGAPVVDQGRLVGFCSERDLVCRVIAEGRDPHLTRVADVMTPKVLTAGLDDTVEQCEAKLREAHCRHLPVVDGENVVGCLSMRDFLSADLAERMAELDQLSAYIRSAGA
jgi:CBS domain-containing protein